MDTRQNKKFALYSSWITWSSKYIWNTLWQTHKSSKKRIEVQNEPENVPIDLYLHEDEGGLPTTPALEGNEKVNLEP